LIWSIVIYAILVSLLLMGFKVSYHRLEFYGLCHQCQRVQENNMPA
jgi:hypothetical protein